MAIKDWPAAERPREKLLQQGAQALTDAELLAIFLRTGVAGQSAVALAQSLLEHFGSLHALLNADQATFTRARGLGTAKYVQLQATLEMARRYFEQPLREGLIVSQPEQVARWLQHQFSDQSRECFMVLFLDTQHRLIHHDTLFFGTVNEAPVYPREVARRALEHNASALIVAHNHPSGSIQPSQADLAITRQLNQALNLLDIRLLDHFIIAAGGRWRSLCQTEPGLFQAA